jgi:hypothetical protein
VNATATAIGGNGGAGLDGAAGGKGASSTLTNAVTGSSLGGTLTLSQEADGGTGGGTKDTPHNN